MGEDLMGFRVEVFDNDKHADAVADAVLAALPGGGSLVLTGGTTAEKIYPRLAGRRADWSGVEVAFSDERCVPPDHAESNYGMARRTFIDVAEPSHVYRMPGELEPSEGATAYSEAIAPLVRHGFDLLLLGMGADHHIGALYPRSPALASERNCEAVARPDGMTGLTLTPPAMLSARKILLLVTGTKKAEAVANAVGGSSPIEDYPVTLLAGHPDVTFLLDADAASRL